jgi:hypothetical protein
MRMKVPSELSVGDIFEEPEWEQKSHGAEKSPVAPERYRVEMTKNMRGLGTHIDAINLGSGRSESMLVWPWVLLEVEG